VTDEEGLGLLGLGMRAGSVVVGTGGVRAGLQRGDVALVVVARNRSQRTGDKVVRLAQAKGVPLATAPSADVLGQSVGRNTVQVVGVRDRRLAAAIRNRMSGEGS
jgi:ribosomal protein L7Ae-like RNA K-turn-binding protein